MRSTLKILFNHDALSFESCRIPLAVSAFSLRSFTSVNLCQGDVFQALLASGAFPLLWAPMALGPPKQDVCTDIAALADAAGIEALPSLPPSGRLLHIGSQDWNIRSLLLKPPSRLPTRLLTCWQGCEHLDSGGAEEKLVGVRRARIAKGEGGGLQGGSDGKDGAVCDIRGGGEVAAAHELEENHGQCSPPILGAAGRDACRGRGEKQEESYQRIEVVSVLLKGHTRVLPWGFQRRGSAALESARSGLLLQLDSPLEPGLEPGHW